MVISLLWCETWGWFSIPRLMLIQTNQHQMRANHSFNGPSPGSQFSTRLCLKQCGAGKRLKLSPRSLLAGFGYPAHWKKRKKQSFVCCLSVLTWENIGRGYSFYVCGCCLFYIPKSAKLPHLGSTSYQS